MPSGRMKAFWKYATDKVDSEVPSVTAGTLEEILFQVNAVVPIGSVIARIRTNGAATQPTTHQAQHSIPAASHQAQPATPNAQATRRPYKDRSPIRLSTGPATASIPRLYLISRPAKAYPSANWNPSPARATKEE